MDKIRQRGIINMLKMKVSEWKNSDGILSFKNPEIRD